jgi:putative endonuclease
MASVYVLYSTSSDLFYIGCTNDLKLRVGYHLLKEFQNSFTAKYTDWELFFEMPDLSMQQARKIEAHIKKMKSRKYFFDLKTYPEISKRLIKRYL